MSAGNRREFVAMLAAGHVLAEQAKVARDAGRDEVIQRAIGLGRDYQAKYRGCAQAVIAALQDAVSFVSKSQELYMAGGCLHGGATATRNANCGAFTGAGIVIGSLCGRRRDQLGDRSAGQLCTTLFRRVATRFEETYGSVLCKDVRARAAEKCDEVVGRAAGWAAEVILEQFGGKRA